MNYSLLETPTLQQSECLVLGLFANEALSDFALQLDQKYHKLISRLLVKLNEGGDFIWQADLDGHSLLLINCGSQDQFNAKSLSKYLKEIIQALVKQRIASVTFCLPAINEFNSEWQLQQMLLQIEQQTYQLTDFKSKNKKALQLESVKFYLPGASAATLKIAEAIADGVKLTRTLADLPANKCTPTYLADQAVSLAKHYEKLSTKILGPDDMHRLGMNAILAVAQGSEEEPRLIEMQYKGGGDTPPIVLVGKGITFDSGGLSLKPANFMDEMKYDMAGAASVFGAIKACAALNLPINLIGIIPSAENMPSGSATKPGDIITSLSGQTIEIINTDAEGRVVLADALTYAERFNPQFVLDFATLTGAMVVALGSVITGFMTQDEDLATQLLAASQTSDDKLWRMPLDDAYQEALESPLADMINANFDRSAGALTAACFLSRFTTKYRWAHLDIAGTAWVSGKKRAATGRPVPLIVELLRHVASTR